VKLQPEDIDIYFLGDPTRDFPQDPLLQLKLRISERIKKNLKQERKTGKKTRFDRLSPIRKELQSLLRPHVCVKMMHSFRLISADNCN